MWGDRKKTTPENKIKNIQLLLSYKKQDTETNNPAFKYKTQETSRWFANSLISI